MDQQLKPRQSNSLRTQQQEVHNENPREPIEGRLRAGRTAPLFLACTDDPFEPSHELITVSPRTVTFRVGQTLRFEANVWAADRDGMEDIAWNSSEPGVAKLLDNRGLVIATAAGSAVISAGCGSYCGTAFVTVIEPGGGEPEEEPDGER